MIITNTLMRDWNTCPQMAKLKSQGMRLREPGPDSLARYFGELFHDAIEAILGGCTVKHPFYTEEMFGGNLNGLSYDESYRFLEDLNEAIRLYQIQLRDCIVDREIIKIMSERTFRVPIVSTRTPRRYTTKHDFMGKVDAIFIDKNNKIWIYELKTRAGNKIEDHAEFHQAPQTTGYAYAMTRVFDQPVLNIIYHVVRRTPPRPPRILKNGNVSVDKRQNTTATLFRAELERMRLDSADYIEMLEHLEAKEEENPFFRETVTFRTEDDLRRFENELYQITCAMTHANNWEACNRFHCHVCPYNDLCNAGERDRYMIDTAYQELDQEVLAAPRSDFSAVKKLTTALQPTAA